jgi:uncharacterized protein YndB with AHSA1/START domain
MAADPIVKEIYIEASADLIFEYLTDPRKMIRWMGIQAELEPKPGGLYRLDPNGRDVIRGSYLEVVPYTRIVFSWGFEEPGHSLPTGSTVVEITLEGKGKGTLLRLIHRELPPELRDMHEYGWTHYLGRLKTLAEGGDPGRDRLSDSSVHHG